jgi:hypothetical protein
VEARLWAAANCGDLEGADARANLLYLQRERSDLSPACVNQAIYAVSLADRKTFDQYADVIEALIKYLGYRLPDESALRRVVHSTRDPYPASSGLFIIGKPSVPYLIDVIASASVSDRARINATDLVFSIYSRENLPDAVRVLKRAGAAAKDWGDSQRLLEAAKKVTAMCKEELEFQCRDALFEPDLE